MPCRLLLSIFFVLSFSAIAQERSAPVTVGEYADFLNAVAVTDSHTLYHETMDGVTRDGEPGDYYYQAVAGAENLPINFVTWFDQARYCNWKEHGSPLRDEVTSETTETGSYTLNDDMSGSVVKNPAAHYVLPMSEEDSFIDPTLASNDRGFTIVEVDRVDHFNAVSFLEASKPEAGDGTWSTFDEVLGVVGVLAMIGGGVGYAYHRCHTAPEDPRMRSSNGTVVETTEANRLLEESPLNVRSEEVVGGTSARIDVVTGKPTEAENFAQDQRSLVKKWADWLRGRDHLNSIFQDADQIDYIVDNDPIPEQRTSFQKFIRWMTQRAYIYKDVADFKKRNLEYLQKKIERRNAALTEHQAAIENHPAVATVVAREATIVELQQMLQGHEQTEQEKKAEEDRARLDRFKKFADDRENLTEIGGYILEISKLEQLCYSACTDPALQHKASSSTIEVRESSLTPFQIVREATQYLVITKLQAIEKAAKRSEHASEERVAAGQIQTQYHEVCKADAELMERLKILASKKALLWKYRAHMKDDFVEHKPAELSVSSIKKKMTDLNTTIENYRTITQGRFNNVKTNFDADQKSNTIRESHDRDSVAQSFSSSNVEKKTKTRNSLAQLFHSSDKSRQSQEALAAAAEVDLPIETACRELGERVKKRFAEEVNSYTDRVEQFFAQSYELLHLAEHNAVLGTELIRLYEADQGRKLWETSSLRPYLRETLKIARKAVSDVSDLFSQEREALVGIWNKRESEDTLNPIYYYEGGGWETFVEEKNVSKGIEDLKKLSNCIRENAPSRLIENIDHAKTIAGLLQEAKVKAEELLSATTATLEARRRDFLEAMKNLLSDPILQPTQQSTGQGQGGEQKEN
ncbi:MAG: hypothetical protein K2W97_04875 [Chthoniobacterales bacterium]|nr:hypothetical protein [Chthoniobacterales bacterium]